MQIVSCPGCGAQVQFRSHASVMAVCEFCRTTVLKDAASVGAQGKLSDVLEDYSPIQVGTSGVVGGRNFNVVGRIQLRYENGFWNEWFLVFDDGASGWLGDASGQYSVTIERAAEGALPAFDEVEPGKLYTVNGERYTAADKRVAKCTGGQGELPFKVGDGWEARVIDLRSGASFVTLDYSDGATPQLYTGHAVTLAGMKAQLLRDDEQIKASAGKYRGKLDALDCPSCGSPIKYLPGVTTQLVCPACAAQLDAAGPQAQVLQAGEKVERVRTTLPLGATANISGTPYTIIGAMTRQDDEGTEWTEYLLYSTRGPFFWLAETDGGWSRADVLDTWPAWSWTGADNVTLDKASYDKLYEYPSRVNWAAGAFNWRVAAGDQLRVYEFALGQATLSAELSDEELSWSRSTPVAFDQVKTWFGANVRGGAPMTPPASAERAGAGAGKFLMWLLMLNVIPLLFNFGASYLPVAIGALALYLPRKFFASESKEKK
ncbi:DUF4178 domain-containing protein [Massilia cavernae]|uniref:DUF4178 domain-containing protein n=1 Tax=Massilia cavernae TaxID=2320864 RepID=A0A418Y6T9_9BURK|nr:DUF4178 domain-containing protein [Massilia cavernae]RJG24432.1 DUF4178 domain-containing protein [Massilia cavernae]